jgi:hypothetical protein
MLVFSFSRELTILSKLNKLIKYAKMFKVEKKYYPIWRLLDEI